MDRPALPTAVGLALGIVIGALRATQQYAAVFFVQRPGAPFAGFLLAVDAVTLLVGTAGAALAGYWLAGRIDAAADWLPAALAVLGGAFVGALFGFGGVVAYGLAGATSTTSTPPFAVVVAYRAFDVALHAAFVALAGVGVREFRQT